MTEKTMSKWELAISKLLEYTQDNKLHWQIVNPRDFLPKDDTKDAMLIVKYEDKTLLLYREAYLKPPVGLNLLVVSTATEREKDYRARLGIYDIKSKVIVYAFPYSPITEDLYNAATYNAANVDEFIYSVLVPKAAVTKSQKRRK